MFQYEGDLGMIRADRGSFRDRPYKISVYSIEDPDTKEVCKISYIYAINKK